MFNTIYLNLQWIVTEVMPFLQSNVSEALGKLHRHTSFQKSLQMSKLVFSGYDHETGKLFCSQRKSDRLVTVYNIIL
jgi:hypothetical protein